MAAAAGSDRTGHRERGVQNVVIRTTITGSMTARDWSR